MKKRKLENSKYEAAKNELVVAQYSKPVQNILIKFNELLKDSYTSGAIKSYTTSAIESYISCDEINNNSNEFKSLINGVKNILKREYNSKADAIFLESIKSAYDFMDSHDYTEEKEVLGGIKYCLEQGEDY